ncbi:hypothetical protein M6B38_318535 [Iris pallida]|uniref:NADH dehydrogenase subunit 4L n=1 Tax=Iris pallida TaxID=29817 RepID=A0AAX6HCC4_IRIPA|nr:hypothetical protein M6B38_318535 [Iris pallida]
MHTHRSRHIFQFMTILFSLIVECNWFGCAYLLTAIIALIVYTFIKISITLLFFIMNSMSHGLSSEICRVGTQGT